MAENDQWAVFPAQSNDVSLISLMFMISDLFLALFSAHYTYRWVCLSRLNLQNIDSILDLFWFYVMFCVVFITLGEE